jgi:hypothetical protein
VFPTTVWEDIEAAGGSDPEALDRLAQQYRAAILAFIRRRGIEGNVAEDLCHEVFVRLISGKVLSKADAGRGRFRSLLCTVTVRVIQDWSRKQTPLPVGDVDPAELAPDFDRVWVLHLVERSLRRLKETSSRSYDVLTSHLAGQEPDRNKLWIARNKLMALIRREIAVTCRSAQEVDEEIVRLTPYLRPAQKAK